MVRRRLPDGSATDVLGTCEAWGATVSLRRADGTVESFPAATVITGKPVPPRASVRARVPGREIELRAFADWAEVVREPLGDWVLRSAPPMGGRLLKRANSALAWGDPGLSLADAARAVAAHYRRLDRRPLVQVERDDEVEAGLRSAGWLPLGIGDSETQLAGVAHVVRRLPEAPPDATTDEQATRLSVDLRGVATGSATLDDDWLCVHSVTVDPEHRRRGLARLVLAELLDWGASRGARTVWLHVESDNAPALALYESLGFRTHHRNRYLTLPA